MATAAKIQIAIEAQTAQLTRDINRAATRVETGMDRIRRGAAQAAAGFALITAAVSASFLAVRRLSALFNEFDALGKLSRQLDVATSELLAWQETVKRAGGSSEDLNRLFVTLQKNVGDATFGIGRAKVIFDELGISVQQIAQLDVVQQFVEINARINELNTDAERTAARIKIFGSSVETLGEFLDQSKGQLQDNADAMREFIGEIDTEKIEKFNDLWADATVLLKTRTVDAVDTAAKSWDVLVASIGGILESPDAFASYEDIYNVFARNRAGPIRAAAEDLERFNRSLRDTVSLGTTEESIFEATLKGVSMGVKEGFATAPVREFSEGLRAELSHRFRDFLNPAETPDRSIGGLPPGVLLGQGGLSLVNRASRSAQQQQQREHKEQLDAQNRTTGAIQANFSRIFTFGGFNR